MNVKFIGAAVVTVALVAVAWKISTDKAPQTEVVRSALYPGLLERLNEVKRIDLRAAKNETSLVRAGDTWTVANRDGFPASFADIKRTILQIADLQIVEPKTNRPDSYARIGVADIGTDGADGTLIEVYADEDEKLLGLIVGNARDAGRQEQRYVRRAGEEQSWLVNGTLDVSADPISWLDAKITDIDTARVSRVAIMPAEGEPVVVSKDSSENNFFGLQNVPDGFVPKSKAIVSSLGALLLDLRFNNVAAAARFADMTPKRTTEVQTFDGLVVRIDEFDDQGKTFARFDFAYDAGMVKPAESAPAAEPEPGEAAPAATADTPATAAAVEASAKPTETAAEEAARWKARTSGWVYELPDYKMRMINKRMEDLVQEKPTDAKGEAKP